jgi:hypothetical protein
MNKCVDLRRRLLTGALADSRALAAESRRAARLVVVWPSRPWSLNENALVIRIADHPAAIDQALLIDAVGLCLGDVVTEIFGTRRIDHIGHRVCHGFILSIFKWHEVPRICRIVAVTAKQVAEKSVESSGFHGAIYLYKTTTLLSRNWGTLTCSGLGACNRRGLSLSMCGTLTHKSNERRNKEKN